ncbi:MAG: DUF3866 family protein [Firmicutes bacterium]|jgi:hypothetical protein|nr:DUF3866 family protein [Bacillota bacterium]
MIRARRGVVVRVTADRHGMQELAVKMVPEGAGGEQEGTGSDEETAVCYPELTGPAAPGDSVILNVTAVSLSLGSGGRHFVIWVEGRQSLNPPLRGHIMKARYMPMQVCTGSYEEDPSNAGAIEGFRGLLGMPVVLCELHSMVPPALAGLAATGVKPPRVAYIMTDGAALPIALSELVDQLREHGLLSVTITAGHAFGGDIEAVTVHSALVAAKAVARCDAAVVSMGPGIVGTGTRYGFSGIEQGYMADAVNRLGGVPILVPRISRADPRPRHRGVSHHTLTVLRDVCCTPVRCVLPSDGDREFIGALTTSLENAATEVGHELVFRPGRPALSLLSSRGIRVSTMGRSPEDDPEFFLAAGAGGVYAREFVLGE